MIQQTGCVQTSRLQSRLSFNQSSYAFCRSTSSSAWAAPRTLRTDARLIAATNRDLKAKEQKFRSDLYYRLNVFPIRVPSLRERKEDIPLLVHHFVKEFSRRNQRVIDTIPSETMQALIRYRWPGNIRELQNLIERAVLISKGPTLNVSLAELKPDLSAAHGSSPANGKSVPPENLQDLVEWTERNQILRALEETNGVVAGPNGAAALSRSKAFDVPA
jgi:formate hydrogenlyase transcriptional activator